MAAARAKSGQTRGGSGAPTANPLSGPHPASAIGLHFRGYETSFTTGDAGFSVRPDPDFAGLPFPSPRNAAGENLQPFPGSSVLQPAPGARPGIVGTHTAGDVIRRSAPVQPAVVALQLGNIGRERVVLGRARSASIQQ